MKRVVITGAGTINALGHDVPQTLEAMKNGTCGIGPLDFRDVDRLMIKIGAQVHDFEPENAFNRQQLSFYDRFTQFTLIAAKQAVSQSGLTFSGELSATSGVVLGTAGGGVSTWDENYRSVYEEGKNRVHPFVVPKLMNNAATSHVLRTNEPRAFPSRSSFFSQGFGARLGLSAGLNSCFLSGALRPVPRVPRFDSCSRFGLSADDRFFLSARTSLSRLFPEGFGMELNYAAKVRCSHRVG